jgi:hypothetical protein
MTNQDNLFKMALLNIFYGSLCDSTKFEIFIRRNPANPLI